MADPIRQTEYMVCLESKNPEEFHQHMIDYIKNRMRTEGKSGLDVLNEDGLHLTPLREGVYIFSRENSRERARSLRKELTEKFEPWGINGSIYEIRQL